MVLVILVMYTIPKIVDLMVMIAKMFLLESGIQTAMLVIHPGLALENVLVVNTTQKHADGMEVIVMNSIRSIQTALLIIHT